jgi:hypothetical protein
MDYVIDVDETHGAIRVTVTTRVLTDDDLTGLYRVLTRFAHKGGPYSAILDLSQVVQMRVTAKTIRALAASAPAVPPGTPRVIVAREPVVFGLSRMFELSRDAMDGQLRVVHSIDQAYGVLGVTAADFSQRVFPEKSAA